MKSVVRSNRKNCRSVAAPTSWFKRTLLVLMLPLAGSTCAQIQSLPEYEIETQHARAARPIGCESLKNLDMRNSKITSAILIPAGSYSPPNVFTVAQQVAGMEITNLPAFCRVLGTIFPTIEFEMWLPTAADWNGKFAQSGSGGLGGFINYAQGATSRTGMAFQLRRGYAVAATNQGHIVNTTEWLLDPGRVVDWSFRAVHEVAVRAKEIIKAHYGSAPKYSYHEGCSAGGAQGIMAAQRYPLDFDGILAAAPGGGRFTASRANNLWNAHAVLKDPATTIPAYKLPLIYNAAITACDAADGLRDGIISNPPACAFDPSVLLCKPGETENCLALAQIQALKKIYQGATNPRTGERISPGMSVGSEQLWAPLVNGPPNVTFYAWAVFQNPSWDWRTFDFDADYEAARAKFSGITDGDDPDLRPFRDHGGKLLMWQGWADQMGPSQAVVGYYNSVIDVIAADRPNRDPIRATQSFARLFMNPGVAHCTAGAGADNFDPFAALEQWVEKGIRPERIIASKIVNGVTQFTRPLCPYPELAMYDGGDPNSETSFVCRTPPVR